LDSVKQRTRWLILAVALSLGGGVYWWGFVEAGVAIGVIGLILTLADWLLPPQQPTPGRLQITEPMITSDGSFDFTIANQGDLGVAVREIRVHPYTPD
jgi:hypothetical protein